MNKKDKAQEGHTHNGQGRRSGGREGKEGHKGVTGTQGHKA